jgi:glycerophosphoryl diester phosphodiesterase
MAQFASGTFTGTDGTELTTHDANWINRTRSGAENCVLTNANRVRGPVNANEYYHSGSPASADYSVEADIYVASSPGNVSASLIGRASTTVGSGYFATLYGASGLRLYKQVGGAFTLLNTYAFTIVAGTTYHVKLEMIGTAIKVYLDGVQRISVTDSAVTAAGKSGVRFANLGSTSNNTTNYHIDNFSADDVGGTPTTYYQNVSGSLTPSGALARLISKSFGGSITPSGAASGTAFVPPDFTAIPTPMYFAHAGNKQLYPEESHTGFDASVASGEIILDFDVWPLSGGATLAVMHDADVDRTTSGTGLISNKSEAQWNALTLNPSTYLGGSYPDTEAPPLLADVLANHATDALFSIECKPTTSGPMDVLLAAMVSAGIAPNQGMVSSFTSSHMAQVITAGYIPMFLCGSTTPVATVQGYGVSWVGVPTSMSTSLIGDYLAAGIKVVPFTINRRNVRDTAVAANPTITGFFSDDSKYLGSATAIATTDNFVSQNWDYGMYASDDAMTAASRGEFFSPDYWGYSSNTTTYRSCLMGFLSPVATPSNFILDLKITFDSANASDDSYYADVVTGTADNGFANTASGLIGHVFRFHKNGTVAVYEKAWLTSPVLRASTTGSTIADGEEKIFRITVTSTAIKAAQIDSGGADITPATWTNSASSRGGYITLGRAGLAAKFRDLSVSEAGTTYSQSLAGSVTGAGALTRQTNKNTAGSISYSGNIVKLTNRSLTSSLTPAGLLSKLTTKAFAGSVTVSGALSTMILFTASLAGSLTPAGALSKLTLKALAGSTTLAGVITKKTFRTLDGNVTVAGALTKLTKIAMAGSVTVAGSLVESYQVLKSLAGSITPAGALATAYIAFVAGVLKLLALMGVGQ